MYSLCAGDPTEEQQHSLGVAAAQPAGMKSEDRVLFTETYCKICNAQLISESQRVAHYESKKHANKVRLYYMLHPEDGGPPSKKLRPDDPESDETEVDKNKCCTLCNMFFTSAIVAESHYQGKTHAKRVKLVLGESPDIPARAEPVQENPEQAEIALQEEDTLWSFNIGSESRKFCDLCRAWFNNPMMAQQHYEGKKHKKNAARARLLQRLGETLDSEALEALRSSYSCNICNMVLNSVEQYHAHLKGVRHQNNANNNSDGSKLNGQGNLQNSPDAQTEPRSNFYTGNDIQKQLVKEGKDNDSGRSSLSPPQVPDETEQCSPDDNFYPVIIGQESHIVC
ncbi:zinc finger matrin-type protein 4 [Aquarana catesbeiana]|uniref:zinc finger matrin-type protein 4 n=1 Tax=Aquarana catesbeiana TaxID=8400 RepID=UPI003CCA0B6E